MRILSAEIEEVKLLEPSIFRDTRGYFLEIFSFAKHDENVLKNNFVQDNFSVSPEGFAKLAMISVMLKRLTEPRPRNAT